MRCEMRGAGTRNQGPGIRDQGSGTRDQGSGTRDQESGTRTRMTRIGLMGAENQLRITNYEGIAADCLAIRLIN